MAERRQLAELQEKRQTLKRGGGGGRGGGGYDLRSGTWASRPRKGKVRKGLSVGAGEVVRRP